MEVPISVVSVVANAGGEDDREPFLSASGGGGSGPSAATSGAARRWCSLRAVGRSLRRLPRPRSVLARVAATVDVRVLGRGLVLCGALLLVGVVGSFALRQMVSPEIDSLVRDRQRLQQALELLKMQLENVTRVAESRLDMIHLLESELEKQAVQAAAAAAAVSGLGLPALALGSNASDVLAAAVAARADPRLQRRLLLPTVLYASMLGGLVFVLLLYRVFRVMQGEMPAPRKPGWLPVDRLEGGSTVGRSASSSSRSSLSPPRTLRGIVVDDSPPPSGRPPLGAVGGLTAKNRGVNAALSPTGINAEPSPQCYKRPQGVSPNDRSIV